MEAKDLRALSPGDVIKSNVDDEVFVVTGNYGGRVTAVMTVDVTNPDEWRLVGHKKDREISLRMSILREAVAVASIVGNAGWEDHFDRMLKKVKG